jgi:hypothetical protein
LVQLPEFQPAGYKTVFRKRSGHGSLIVFAHDVIGIREQECIPSCDPGTGIPGVAGTTASRGVYNSKIWELVPELLDHSAGAVGRTVVGDNHFPRPGVPLVSQGFELFSDSRRGVVRCDNDAQLRQAARGFGRFCYLWSRFSSQGFELRT